MTIESGTPNTLFDVPRRLPPSTGTRSAEFMQAFEEILGEPYDGVFIYAMRQALRLTHGNEHDAADLVQDAFIRILKYTFDRPVIGRAFVVRILVNLHIDRVRRQDTQSRKLGTRTGYEIALDEGVRDRTAGDVADTVTDSIFWVEVRHRITTLDRSLDKEDQRTVLRALVDFDSGALRPVKDIAELTGFSDSKVKRLRAQLGPLLEAALAGLSNPDTLS
ncbi:RNA polymerase sigma factor [Rhodococcus sp. Q]|uniref:RNA polymerase sigma factor n=1 Tax=Rhodococcus sp. Q TaxID=2502252 RepID=UPI0010F7BAEB|nr:RNA polymerase sigma factor [Rhodococcus sp. Q]